MYKKKKKVESSGSRGPGCLGGARFIRTEADGSHNARGRESGIHVAGFMTA